MDKGMTDQARQNQDGLHVAVPDRNLVLVKAPSNVRALQPCMREGDGRHPLQRRVAIYRHTCQAAFSRQCPAAYYRRKRLLECSVNRAYQGRP